MAEIVQFTSQVEQDKQSAVELLEKTLELVRAGAVVSVAIGTVTCDGRVKAHWSDGELGPLYLSAGLLQRSLMDTLLDDD